MKELKRARKHLRIAEQCLSSVEQKVASFREPQSPWRSLKDDPPGATERQILLRGNGHVAVAEVSASLESGLTNFFVADTAWYETVSDALLHYDQWMEIPS